MPAGNASLSVPDVEASNPSASGSEADPAKVASQVAELSIGAIASEPPRQDPTAFWRLASPYVVAGYLCGVLLMLTRLAIAFGGGERLRRSSLPVNDSRWLSLLQSKAKEFGLTAAPAIACCERVAAPIIVGALKPTILLPACILSELSPAQIEAVLAHELAHIRRWDHVANLIQRVIESLLFFFIRPCGSSAVVSAASVKTAATTWCWPTARKRRAMPNCWSAFRR